MVRILKLLVMFLCLVAFGMFLCLVALVFFACVLYCALVELGG